MKIIDMHCDTISRLYAAQNAAPDPFSPGADMPGGFHGSLRQNHFHIDLHKLRRGDYLLQNFALFVDAKETADPQKTALAMADLYYRELEANADLIRPVFSYADIEENRRLGKISAMLTLEEGGIFGGSLAHLHRFYRMGVRMATLTWNYENEIGSPNLHRKPDGAPLFSRRSQKGLTAFGIELIREMERLGMIIDVSHLSDGGFYDVAKHTRAPFAASHSNAAAQCNVCRNLTDDMIRLLGERGGVIGLNYCTDFLAAPTAAADEKPRIPGGSVFSMPHQVSRISDMVRHIRHIVNVGGIDVCALGGDMDGIANRLEFGDASGIQMLADALSKNGFSTDEIEKICYRNALRLYREVLQD